MASRRRLREQLRQQRAGRTDRDLVTYIVLSGGPATKIDPALAKQTDGSGIRLLTPDENEPAPR